VIRGRLRRIRLPILYYHEIGTVRSKHAVHHADFEAQLDWLIGAGFEALTMDDVVAVYAGARPVPQRGVVLSFDDGRAGVRDFAAPALARRGLPAMLYLVTDWLGDGQIPESERYSDFVGWSDLPVLQQAGLRIGSHTVSHPNLKRIAPGEVERELRTSRLRLEEELGGAVEHFSYPYGRRTRSVEKAVRAAGYRTAVVTGERCNGRLARLHRLYRLRVDGREGREGVQRSLEDCCRGSAQEAPPAGAASGVLRQKGA
jgi:peptidoglycan/xylan/chitin deacetylase (PgdA/CDA1 family)